MSTRESDVNPFLQGNFAPLQSEDDVQDLQVIGEIPRELVGTYFRNGPNPAFEPPGRYHWFDGDGMIHGIRLRDGKASYRNRWVRNRGIEEEFAAGRASYKGLLEMDPGEGMAFKNTANTNIVWHAGKLLALMEAALPTRMEPRSLATLGEWDFDGKLIGAMTAHPKMDPETGEMLFFGYSPFPPYLQYHVAAADGSLVRSEVIDLEWPTMMHDFAITKDHVIFMLCPIVFSFENVKARGSVFSWEPERGTKLGVMPRNGGSADIRWFDTDPCYVFHPMNAYDADGTVVLDVARYGRLDFMLPEAARDPKMRGDNSARMHRWTIDLRGGGVRSTPLDDAVAEFPRVDERLVGRKHRFGYAAVRESSSDDGGLPFWSCVRKYDMETGRTETRSFGDANGVGEPIFVPRTEGAAEDDGWVLALCYDKASNGSDFFVLDARNIAGEPVARVRLPHRVPYGFHGNWAAGV